MERSYKIAALEPETLGFPHAEQVIEETKRHLDPKTGKVRISSKTGEEKIFLRWFVTSLRPSQTTPQRLAEYIRGHWGVENRNHWRRDASRWQEDKCRLRNPRAAFNFALLRNAMLALLLPTEQTMSEIFDHHTRNPAAAIKLLNSKIRKS